MTRGPSLQAESLSESYSLNNSSSTLVERLRAADELYKTGDVPYYAINELDSLLEEAATLISELQAERDRIKAFLSEGSWDTIQSEQAWKRRALAAESALSRIQSETVEAWQPIETVLKDGSDVLLYFPLEGLSADWPKIVIGHWRDIDGTRGHWVWQSRAFRGYSDEYHPTHWQPLSPPRSLKLPDYRGGEAKTAQSGNSLRREKGD